MKLQWAKARCPVAEVEDHHQHDHSEKKLTVYVEISIFQNETYNTIFKSINTGYNMKSEFTAIIEAAPEGGYWAICPEVPGANGQGETPETAKKSLKEAIELIFEDRRSDILRGLPDDAIQEKVVIG